MMISNTMEPRTCNQCGFDNAEVGKPCSLCGADETLATQVTDQLPTVRAFAESPDDQPVHPDGQLYAERYRIASFVGKGGMGCVYRVVDTTDGSTRALKVLHPWIAREASGSERFKREIDILMRINHPSVPRICGYGKCGLELYYVADFIDGTDLRSVLERKKRLEPAAACVLTAAVADALSAAHAAGIIHRDVKPSNIMMDEQQNVHLVDFGVARGEGPGMETLTRTGMVMGTPEYMSPEHFDSHTVDERSDIYSLGVVLYEELTGSRPFVGNTPFAIALKHKSEPPPPPRTVCRDVPGWLDRLVLKCLEKDPALRFGSMAEFAVELRKPRTARPEVHRHPHGDLIVEDPSGLTRWPLEIKTNRPKTGWEIGMALTYREQHFKLLEIERPSGGPSSWAFLFDYWPAHEVFRRHIDYEADCDTKSREEEQKIGTRLKKFINRQQQ